MLVLPGLVADRARRRVEVSVERSAVGRDEPCEFLVLAEDSDHTYETLLIAFAAPGDVQRALEFVGFRPGLPHDPAALRFWPKGESVRLTLARSNEPPVALESLLADRGSGREFPPGYFLFTGSRSLPAKGTNEPPVLAADVEQPKAIAALFNSPDSVLAVPGRAPKDVVYQNTVVRLVEPFEGGGLLTLVLEPSGISFADLELEVSGPVEQARARPDTDAGTITNTNTNTSPVALEGDRLRDLRIRMRGPGLDTPEGGESLPRVLERLANLDRRGRDYFATVRFEDALDLAHVRSMAGVLALVDAERGIRVEPPPAGHLHYLAFRPDPRLLDRGTRILNPPELVLSEKAGRLTGRLITLVPRPGTEGRNEGLEVGDAAVGGAGDLQRELELFDRRTRAQPGPPPPPVLLVFAPSGLSYGALRGFLGESLRTHPTVHVHLDLPRGAESPWSSTDGVSSPVR